MTDPHVQAEELFAELRECLRRVRKRVDVIEDEGTFYWNRQHEQARDMIDATLASISSPIEAVAEAWKVTFNGGRTWHLESVEPTIGEYYPLYPHPAPNGRGEAVAWRRRFSVNGIETWEYASHKSTLPDDAQALVPASVLAAYQADRDEARAERDALIDQRNVIVPRLEAAEAKVAALAAENEALNEKLTQATEWAGSWQQCCATAEVLLGIGPCLSASEFPGAVQAYVAASDRTALRTALEPFARNVDAISLAKTLGHITREDLHRARMALKDEG